ncbi:MAG: hypothetical protein QXP36_08700 [Conexivisphaerales archaeon]|uniref:hypothetical protein n=1 Tax=Sulfolobaceae TaxID=118883 RepID=UPI003173E9BF
MPHTAGSGYTAVKQWIQDNLPAIISGDVPLDFGNPTAQRVAIDYLFKLMDINVPSEITQGFDLIFNQLTPFPKREEPSLFAQSLKQSLSGVLQRTKSFFSSAFGKLKSFFTGG